MPQILYSALAAPTSWENVLITVMPLVIGTAMMWASWRGIGTFTGLSPTFGRILLMVVGFCLCILGAYFTGHNLANTLACRSALRDGNVSVVTGMLTVDEVIPYRGKASGYIKFTIDGKSYTTATDGPCDCGYIQSVGTVVQHAANTRVKAHLRNGVVLGLESVP